MYDIYIVSNSIDPRDYKEYWVEAGISEEDLDSYTKKWDAEIDHKNFSLIVERN